LIHRILFSSLPGIVCCDEDERATKIQPCPKCGKYSSWWSYNCGSCGFTYTVPNSKGLKVKENSRLCSKCLTHSMEGFVEKKETYSRKGKLVLTTTLLWICPVCGQTKPRFRDGVGDDLPLSMRKNYSWAYLYGRAESWLYSLKGGYYKILPGDNKLLAELRNIMYSQGISIGFIKSIPHEWQPYKRWLPSQKGLKKYEERQEAILKKADELYVKNLIKHYGDITIATRECDKELKRIFGKFEF
jgi:hypothetical protein